MIINDEVLADYIFSLVAQIEASENAIAEEREACAKIADEHKRSVSKKSSKYKPFTHFSDEDVKQLRQEIRVEERGEAIAADTIARAIRARSRQTGEERKDE